VEGDLKTGHDGDRWARTGTGKKGSPYRYGAQPGFDPRTPHAIGARIESGPPAGDGEVRS
jgi:hypothetical protein